MSTNLPTFAERVKNSVEGRLKRPTCLNLKTKSNLKRHEVIDLLNELNFDSGKLIGVAEMRSRLIDITCKKRENILELYKILKKCDSVYNVRLYEPEHVNVLLGWVPIPLSNDIIKKSIEEVFGKATKITEKRHKDGLQSGIRLISMSKNDVETNPLPSYITLMATNYTLLILAKQSPANTNTVEKQVICKPSEKSENQIFPHCKKIA